MRVNCRPGITWQLKDSKKADKKGTKMTETAKTRLFHGTVLQLVAAISVLSLDSHAQQQEASAQALEEVIVFSRY